MGVFLEAQFFQAGPVRFADVFEGHHDVQLFIFAVGRAARVAVPGEDRQGFDQVEEAAGLPILVGALIRHSQGLRAHPSSHLFYGTLGLRFPSTSPPNQVGGVGCDQEKVTGARIEVKQLCQKSFF